MKKRARSLHNGYGRIFSSYKSSGAGRSTEFLPACPNSSSDENLATRRSMSRCGWHGFSQEIEAAQSGGRLSSENGKECYLEVGSFQGKSLVAALAGNSHVRAVACDNFTLFDDPNSPKNFDILKQNLASYRLSERVQFFDCDFRELLTSWNVRQLPRVGVYFYDGAHDEESQFLGVRMAEDLLADNAVVIVDDWRHAKDSESYAEAGTKRAISDSPNEWSIRHVLPARYNGDLELWWNGVGVLRFKRVQPMPDQMM